MGRTFRTGYAPKENCGSSSPHPASDGNSCSHSFRHAPSAHPDAPTPSDPRSGSYDQGLRRDSLRFTRIPTATDRPKSLVPAKRASACHHALSFTQHVDYPNGMMLNIAAVRHTFPDGTQLEGVSITPDVPIDPTPDDIRSSRDPVLKNLLNSLDSRKPLRNRSPVTDLAGNQSLHKPAHVFDRPLSEELCSAYSAEILCGLCVLRFLSLLFARTLPHARRRSRP